MYKKIIQRANKERRPADHIGWYGICTRCGLETKMFGDDILARYGDFRVDLRNKDEYCKSPRCAGRIRWYGRMPMKKSLHFNDIRRRK